MKRRREGEEEDVDLHPENKKRKIDFSASEPIERNAQVMKFRRCSEVNCLVISPMELRKCPECERGFCSRHFAVDRHNCDPLQDVQKVVEREVMIFDPDGTVLKTFKINEINRNKKIVDIPEIEPDFFRNGFMEAFSGSVSSRFSCRKDDTLEMLDNGNIVRLRATKDRSYYNGDTLANSIPSLSLRNMKENEHLKQPTNSCSSHGSSKISKRSRGRKRGRTLKSLFKVRRDELEQGRNGGKEIKETIEDDSEMGQFVVKRKQFWKRIFESRWVFPILLLLVVVFPAVGNILWYLIEVIPAFLGYEGKA